MNRTYTTLSGHCIELSPSTEVEAFLSRLEANIADPRMTQARLMGLAYSVENPMLDLALMPGRGAVTARVMEDPAYHAMTDMLFRHEVMEQHWDVEVMAAHYSMTTSQAAEAVGVDESAVLDAIAHKRLASWIKDGETYVDPRALSSPITWGTL